MAWSILDQFGKEDESWTGFMERGVRAEGKFKLPGTFRIDAEIKGTIESESVLILGEHARVEGTIEGNSVVILGRFEGILRARTRVEIHSKGFVKGDIHCSCLVIEPGGIFDGHCHTETESVPGKPVKIPVRGDARS
jgi:cytoskeletal protein CcmA (bactofilin family)